MAEVIGVHGIRQTKTSQRQLTSDWRAALTRGVTSIEGGGAYIPTLEVPHWTSLLAQSGRLGPKDMLFDESVPMTQAEQDFVTEALQEMVRPEDLVRAEELPLPTLGLPKLWSRRLTRLVIAYDQRFPWGGGGLFVNAMREVNCYLKQPALAAEVQALVYDAFTDATSAIIGHSLGSVIAYDLLRQGEAATHGAPGPGVTTLVTCGSPLGIPSVRRAMGIPDHEPLQLPKHIQWVNVFDPDDFITGGTGLDAMAVTNTAVHNGNADPHAAQRYLRAFPVARAVMDSRQ